MIWLMIVWLFLWAAHASAVEKLLKQIIQEIRMNRRNNDVW